MLTYNVLAILYFLRLGIGGEWPAAVVAGGGVAWDPVAPACAPMATATHGRRGRERTAEAGIG
jgi:hypothetical protein